MGGNEEATLVTLTAHRKIIDSLIEQHHGRFVNSAGDSVLAEFASVVEAVNCAVNIQIALKAENAKLPPERRMEFRIGVNLGDVMVEGDQIYVTGSTSRRGSRISPTPAEFASRGRSTNRYRTSLRWVTRTAVSRQSRTSRVRCTCGGCCWMGAHRRAPSPDGLRVGIGTPGSFRLWGSRSSRARS
jgi:hypothetical protein